jgi:hypothetical protein
LIANTTAVGLSTFYFGFEVHASDRPAASDVVERVVLRAFAVNPNP